MRAHFLRVALLLNVIIDIPRAPAVALDGAGKASCKCVDRLPVLANITVNTISNQHTRFALKGKSRDPVDDCLVASHIDRLRLPHESYCYPINYGRSKCETWDNHLPPECANWVGHGDITRHPYEMPEDCKGLMVEFDQGHCTALFPEKSGGLPWCQEQWCYVDPENCDMPMSPSYYFPGRNLWYSYQTCASTNYFELWDAPLMDMCEHFEVVEKPYPIMWFSCWACAVMQQVIDLTRYFDEQQDRLSRGQRVYLSFQLIVLVSETIANIRRVPWGNGHIWADYNLYVYVFIHSSVFVRATMMSQIVWDWYEVKLLKSPAVGEWVDGKGWHDEHRAILLVIIFQFLSSLFVFGLVFITHVLPALIIYNWIFLLGAAGLVKSRTWVALLGLDPIESPMGRALVMGFNSFVSCMCIQVLVTCMVRVYAGELSAGYMVPLSNDFSSRRLDVWWACHLGKAGGFSVKLFSDQDFINLFLR